MSHREAHLALLLEGPCLDVTQLAAAIAADAEWVELHVREGLLQAAGDAPGAWRFSAHELWRARQMRRFERDFDAVPELAALIADLLAELQAVRGRQRQAVTAP